MTIAVDLGRKANKQTNIQSTHAHKLHGDVLLQVLMAIVCVIANLFFLLTKNDIIVHYNKFPNSVRGLPPYFSQSERP